MASRVVYFLMVILCSATLLHAGVVSDDDNESETEAPTTSVAIDESTEDPDGYFLDELALRRKRSAGGVGSLKTVAADSTSAGGVDSLKTVAADSTDIGDKKDAVASPVVVPDHSRTRREDKSKKAGGNPSAPATANENQGNNRRLPTIPEKSRAIRAAQSQETRGATLLTSSKSAPVSVPTNNRSKVASPAADSRKTPSAPASGKKPTSAQ